MTVSADELFIFAGAGVSRSVPACLPTFDALRDEILNQLGLRQYMWSKDESGPQKVAEALAPELFMLGLSEAGINVESWLGKVLSGTQPNAAHQALARLAARGSRVWTVNFDTLIERASPPGQALRTVAWPVPPQPDTQLLKPHGTVGGPLIVTARQVIGELAGPWKERLRSDVRGRTVLFIGYRGRDLDFQPIWDDVLREAVEVIWFDVRNNDGTMNEAAEKEKLLAGVNARGKLTLAPPAPLPAGIPASAGHNPSWDFIAWCQERHLIDIDPADVRRLFEDAPKQGRPYPPLPGKTVWARPAVQAMLGDYKGARASYWRAARRPGYAGKAAYRLGMSHVIHGGNGTAALLGAATLLPARGRIGSARELALRMRLTAWARTARHKAVLRATRNLPDGLPSVYLILRSESVRVTGSLDEAAAIAEQGRKKARAEEHEVRLAHAAFQEGLALLWADRMDDVRACLDDSLLEYARLAGNRWTAWAAFVEAGWEVHSGHGKEALEKYDEAEIRFRAEGLLDGVVSVDTARLAAYRLTGDDSEYVKTLERVTTASRGETRGTRYYTRRNDFTAESIMNDQAEWMRCSRHEVDAAARMYEETAASRHPLQSALGHLGLALIQAERGEEPTHAAIALRVAEDIGCRLVAARSHELLTPPIPPDVLREVYFV
jgi:hypothetical protein